MVATAPANITQKQKESMIITGIQRLNWAGICLHINEIFVPRKYINLDHLFSFHTLAKFYTKNLQGALDVRLLNSQAIFQPHFRSILTALAHFTNTGKESQLFNFGVTPPALSLTNIFTPLMAATLIQPTKNSDTLQAYNNVRMS